MSPSGSSDPRVARERRERERRERERRRADAGPPREGDRRRGARRAAVRRTTADRRRDSAPSGGTAVASRERHEGAIAWIARGIASAPRGAVGLARGVATEIVGIFTGIGRGVLRLVPGVSRRRPPVAKVPTAAGAATTAVPRVRRRPVVRRPSAKAGTPVSEADRRAAERRRERVRVRLRVGAVVLLLVAVLASWLLVPTSRAFKIRHVEMVGAGSVGDLQLRERIDSLLEGKTVFTVDEDAIERRLEELPFVQDATVVRHLPGGLEIRVREYRPLALGYGDGEFWLVARDGRILSKARPEEWAGRIPTVTLRGTHLAPGKRVGDEPALRLLTARPANSVLELQKVEAERHTLVGTLADGVQVRFGRPEQLLQKLVVADIWVRYAQSKDRELRYIDVTVPGKPALCFADVPACNLPRGRAAVSAAAAGRAVGAADADATTTPEEVGGVAASDAAQDQEEAATGTSDATPTAANPA